MGIQHMRVLYKVAICIVCLVGCFWGRTYPAFDAHVSVHTSDLSTGGILDALTSLGYVVSEEMFIGNIGGFVIISPEKGYVVIHTDIVPSTHLSPFSRVDGTVGAQIYQILEWCGASR